MATMSNKEVTNAVLDAWEQTVKAGNRMTREVARVLRRAYQRGPADHVEALGRLLLTYGEDPEKDEASSIVDELIEIRDRAGRDTKKASLDLERMYKSINALVERGECSTLELMRVGIAIGKTEEGIRCAVQALSDQRAREDK